ncbi:hypothetical protein HELRODRAFT_175674 [Helobdella robusta]|uniref:Uncharacterized protein n=1 Tax=Helobdella robusta TaxID=6412 RepID=T1F9I4_HELRO|nr:hypothetical protein HELRODRAFT_175674 [Helobdella robusta]ESO00690.1 hypothetical protein HELRODRAFT_175674 [Helobdella robusta]
MDNKKQSKSNKLSACSVGSDDDYDGHVINEETALIQTNKHSVCNSRRSSNNSNIIVISTCNSRRSSNNSNVLNLNSSNSSNCNSNNNSNCNSHNNSKKKNNACNQQMPQITIIENKCDDSESDAIRNSRSSNNNDDQQPQQQNDRLLKCAKVTNQARHSAPSISVQNIVDKLIPVAAENRKTDTSNTSTDNVAIPRQDGSGSLSPIPVNNSNSSVHSQPPASPLTNLSSSHLLNPNQSGTGERERSSSLHTQPQPQQLQQLQQLQQPRYKPMQPIQAAASTTVDKGPSISSVLISKVKDRIQDKVIILITIF